MNTDTFVAYGKDLQERARRLGFAPCGYRAFPGMTRAIVRAPKGTVVKVNCHQPDDKILDDMWVGTVLALGLDLEDPIGASFRPGQTPGTVREERRVGMGVDEPPPVAEGRPCPHPTTEGWG